MPSIIAHSIHGEKVKNRLNRSDADDAAFSWGVQGPDFFYYHRLLPWMKGKSLKDWSERFHRRAGEVTDVMKNAAGSDPLKQAYVRGLCCHFALDSEAGPYITWLVDRLREETGETPENLINETGAALDTILLRHEEGGLANEAALKAYLPENARVQKIAAQLYCLAAQEVFGETLPEEAVFEATEDARKALNVLTDKTSLKRALIGKFENKKALRLSLLIRPMLEDADYANINKVLWKDKEGAEHDADFFELVEAAVQKALDSIGG